MIRVTVNNIAVREAALLRE